MIENLQRSEKEKEANHWMENKKINTNSIKRKIKNQNQERTHSKDDTTQSNLNIFKKFTLKIRSYRKYYTQDKEKKNYDQTSLIKIQWQRC